MTTTTTETTTSAPRTRRTKTDRLSLPSAIRPDSPVISLEAPATSPEPLSAIQPTSRTAVAELPKQSVLIRNQDRLVIERTGNETHTVQGKHLVIPYLVVFNKTSDEPETIHLKNEDFAITEKGFSVKGKEYHLERYGDADSENHLSLAVQTLLDITQQEKTAAASMLDLAKSKGEELSRLRDKVPLSHYRLILQKAEISESSARVYVTIASEWGNFEQQSNTSIADALKQISKVKKGDGKKKKADKPRLQAWEQSLVDLASELRVKGSVSNLVRFLAKFGIDEVMIREKIRPV